MRFRIALTVELGRGGQAVPEDHELEAETRIAGFQPNEVEDDDDGA